ncbi:MAG: glycosyltransferase family 2 protein [Desulfovibrionales bacterium]
MNEKRLPLVTVAIPTYNRGDGYLSTAVCSATSQTYGNIEIIISDNCSDDDTESVVRGFKDERILYIRHERNIGPNSNFNFCLKQARGDYFLLLHDDDLIDPDFVESCLRAAEMKIDCGLIRTGTRVIDENNRVLSVWENRVSGLPLDDFFLGWFRGLTAYYLCSSLFNTEKLRELSGFHSRTNLYQDVVAEVQLAARYGRIDVREPKASFRKHSQERTFNVPINAWCDDALYLLEIMAYLAENKKEQVLREGRAFFANALYGKANHLPNLSERIRMYRKIYKMFDYAYHPLQFFLSRNPYFLRVRRLAMSMA